MIMYFLPDDDCDNYFLFFFSPDIIQFPNLFAIEKGNCNVNDRAQEIK